MGEPTWKEILKMVAQMRMSMNRCVANKAAPSGRVGITSKPRPSAATEPADRRRARVVTRALVKGGTGDTGGFLEEAPRNNLPPTWQGRITEETAPPFEPDYDVPFPQFVKPYNGDPFIGHLESPITSSPWIVWLVSNTPWYRRMVSPLQRGVEIGLAHGFWVCGPFIKCGPLKATPDAELGGCIAGAALMLIVCWGATMYGEVTYYDWKPEHPLKMVSLSGKKLPQDPLFTSEGWHKMVAGVTAGSLSGALWCYILTQTLPYYNLIGYLGGPAKF